MARELRLALLLCLFTCVLSPARADRADDKRALEESSSPLYNIHSLSAIQVREETD